MAFTVNTNVLSMNAQTNLAKSQAKLNTAIERLSSGFKINSAKDNAAGQAIANRMTAQINGLKQAASNANDGISLSQTTEGALNQINDNLQRIRTLTVQASNGSNSDSDLASIQAEIEQRLSEIDRISSQTTFNGRGVLDGSVASIDIQVGDKDGQTISLDLKKMDVSTLKLTGFNVSGLSGPISSIKTDDGAGVTTEAEVDLTAVTGGGISATLTLHGYGAYNSVTGKFANYAVKDENGDLYKIAAGDVTAATGVVSHTFADATAVAAAKTAYEADVTAGLTSTANPMKALDAALTKVDDLRSSLGAMQNRFESAIANIDFTTNNLSAARSRIIDTDYAVEVSNMTRAQILQQAGTAVLAQANMTNQGALSLLQG